MEYAQVPVIWESPTPDDFYHVAGLLQALPAKKTLVHCQVNFRASTFSFLYRVLFDDVPIAEAKADLNTVWVPNATWRSLMRKPVQCPLPPAFTRPMALQGYSMALTSTRPLVVAVCA